jgi:hypothetical protein
VHRQPKPPWEKTRSEVVAAIRDREVEDALAIASKLLRGDPGVSFMTFALFNRVAFPLAREVRRLRAELGRRDLDDDHHRRWPTHTNPEVTGGSEA